MKNQFTFHATPYFLKPALHIYFLSELRQDIAKVFLRRSYIASRVERSLGEVAEADRTVHLIR